MRMFLITAFALLCFGGTAQAWPWDHNTNVTCYGGDGKVSMRVSNAYPTTVNCSDRTEKRTVSRTARRRVPAHAVRKQMHREEAAGPRSWKHFGADPAYKTRAAAIADAENVFRRAGWPPEVAAEMAAKMRSAHGEPFTIVNGQRYDFMRTGLHGLWRNVLVAFGKPAKGADYIVHAERWVIEKGGVTYEADLPETCENLAGKRTGAPPPPPPCDLVIAPVGERDVESHNPIYGPAESPTCHGYEWVTLEGDTIRVLENGGELAPGCPENDVCNYRGADAMAAPLERTFAGVAKLHPGLIAYRVDRAHSTDAGFLFGVCVLHYDPETDEWYTSETALVRPEDYRTMPNGQRVAIIFYSSTDMTKAGHVENDPGGLYLWKK